MIGTLCIIGMIFAGPQKGRPTPDGLTSQWANFVSAARKGEAQEQQSALLQAFTEAHAAQAISDWTDTEYEQAKPLKLIVITGEIVDEPIPQGKYAMALIRTPDDTFYPVRFPKDRYTPTQPIHYVAGILKPDKVRFRSREFPAYLEAVLWFELQTAFHQALPPPDAPPPPKPTPRPKKERPVIGTGLRSNK